MPEIDSMGKENGKIDQDPRHAIPRSLPLLEYVAERSKLVERRPLAGYKVLAVQHLLGSTVPLLDMLVRGGVRAADIHVVGKAYSAHSAVVEHLQGKGHKVVGNPFDFDPNRPYSSVLAENVERALDAIVATPEFIDGDTKVIILEDGGEAVRILHQKYPNLLSRFVGVEQTSMGAHSLRNIELEIPVINVARSDAKTRIESPIIAKSVVDEFDAFMQKYSGVIEIRNNTVFIMGYGFIGDSVAGELEKRGYAVIVYDPDSEAYEKAALDGRGVVSDPRDGYQQAGIVIGCSGMASVLPHKLSDIPHGTLLLNASSSDKEFSAWDLRNKGTVIDSDELPWRSLYNVGTDDSPVYLANAGFPINFSGDVDPIPPQDIQLTRALLLGGVLQSVTSQTTGLIDLDQSMQEDILAEFARIRNTN